MSTEGPVPPSAIGGLWGIDTLERCRDSRSPGLARSLLHRWKDSQQEAEAMAGCPWLL
jgi:hypothetical protein